MKQLLRLCILLTLTVACRASTTLTINVTSMSGGTAPGSSIRIDLQNCASARVVGTGQIVPQSQTIYPVNGVAVVTLYSNSDGAGGGQIDCSGKPVSYYSFNFIYQGVITSIGSYNLLPGSFQLANLTPCVGTACIQGGGGGNPGYLLTNPTVSQAVNQPTGTTLTLNGNVVIPGLSGYLATNPTTDQNVNQPAGTSLTVTSAIIQRANLNATVNPSHYGVPSNLSAVTTTGTGTGSTITLASAASFSPTQGLMVAHAGEACGTVRGTACPIGPTPTVTPSTGSTVWTYRVACIDGLGGVGVAGTSVSVNGAASLSTGPNKINIPYVAGCIKTIVYRNGVLIGAQNLAGPSDYRQGINVMVDNGLAPITAHRDLPLTPPATALTDNYVGQITTINGTVAGLVPAMVTAVSGARVMHSDDRLVQIAANTSAVPVVVGDTTYRITKPLNLVGHRGRYTLDLALDTGDIGVDVTAQSDIAWIDSHFGFGSPTLTAPSTVGLYCARNAAGDIAQYMNSDRLQIFTGSDHQLTGTGRGSYAYYNSACEIQNHTASDFESDSAFAMTAQNFDAIHSPYTVDATGNNSMSQVNFVNYVGGSFGTIGLLENAYSITMTSGYINGGFSRDDYASMDLYGQNGDINIYGFRSELKESAMHLFPGASLRDADIKWMLNRIDNTHPAFQLDDGAQISESQIYADNFGGTVTDVPFYSCATSNCLIATSTLRLGYHQTLDPTHLASVAVWEANGSKYTYFGNPTTKGTEKADAYNTVANGSFQINGGKVVGSNTVNTLADGPIILASGPTLAGLFQVNMAGTGRREMMNIMVSAIQFDGTADWWVATDHFYNSQQMITNVRVVLDGSGNDQLVADLGNRASANLMTVTQIGDGQTPANLLPGGTAGTNLVTNTHPTPGALPSGTTNQLLYYAAPGTTLSPLSLGANLSISAGVISAASTAATAFSAISAGTNANALLMGSGGSLAATGTGTITATALTYYASTSTASGTAAKINAMDTLLGAACGTIVVDGPLAGTTVSATVALANCHNLDIRVPLTWTDRITVAGNNKITSNGQSALQTFGTFPTSAGFGTAWITATSVNNVSVDGIWHTWTTRLGGDTGNRLFYCKGCNTLLTANTHGTGGGYLMTDSVTGVYSTTTTSNSTYNVTAYNNYVDGVDGPSGNLEAAFYRFTYFVNDGAQFCYNLSFCKYGWGGNNNTEWTAYTPSTLKAGSMNFSGTIFKNVTAADQFIMLVGGSSVGAIGSGCTDVCIDVEGGQGITASAYTLSGAVNGELAVFYHSVGVKYGPGFVNHTVSGPNSYSFLLVNGTNDPSKSQDTLVTGTTFTCGVVATSCPGFKLDPAADTVISNNKLVDTFGRNSSSAPEQGNVTWRNNPFSSTKANTILVDVHTNSNTTLTAVASSNFFGINGGTPVVCSNVPGGTVIVGQPNIAAGTITLSAAATSSIDTTCTMTASALDVSTFNGGQQAAVEGNTFKSSAAQVTQTAAIRSVNAFNNGNFSVPYFTLKGNVIQDYPVGLALEIASNTQGGVPTAVSSGNNFGSTGIQVDVHGITSYMGIAEQPGVTVTSNTTSFGNLAAGVVTITGTNPIATMVVPTTYPQTGQASFDALASGAWSTTSAGNIATVMTATAGNMYRWSWNGTKWYITTPGSGGSGISGLTTNTIPKATSSTAIGNSSVTDNGTTVATTETVTALGFISTDTVNNSQHDATSGSGGTATCPTPAAGHDFYCYSTALGGDAIARNGAAYVLIPLSSPTTIANIVVTLPTTAIAANTCTTAATATMTGLATTSTFSTAFATSPNAVTGWGSSGGLTFTAWPTTNTLNWSVCNQTAASITPGAMSLNVGAK